MIKGLSSYFSKPLSKISLWHVARWVAIVCIICALVGTIIALIQCRFSLGSFFALLALVEYVHWHYLGKDKMLHKTLETHQATFEDHLSSFKTENETLKSQVSNLSTLLDQANSQLERTKTQINKLEDLTHNYEEQNATLFSQTKSLFGIRTSLSKKIHKMSLIKNSLRDRCRQLISQRVYLRKVVYLLKTQTKKFACSNKRLEKITDRLFRLGKNLAQ